MKICHLAIIHNVFCDSRILSKMCVSAVNAGHEVSIIASNTPDTVFNGVDVLSVSDKPLRRADVTRKLFSAYRLALKAKADVYHVHEIPLLFVGIMLRCFNGKKVLMDFHEDFEADLMEKDYLPIFARHILRLLFIPVRLFLVPLFSGVVLAEDDYLIRYGHLKRKVVIHNYPIVDSIRFDSLKGRPQAASIKVCYVGTISESRGALDLLEALKIIHQEHRLPYEVIFVGPIHSLEFSEKILAFVDKNALGKVVTFAGVRPYEEIMNAITNYHIGFSALHDEPNLRGSLPTKILEYGAAGLPCIASDFPVTHEYVRNKTTGYIIQPQRPNAVAKAILKIGRDWERYLKYRQVCHEYVASHYTWSEEFETLNNFYDSCAYREK